MCHGDAEWNEIAFWINGTNTVAMNLESRIRVRVWSDLLLLFGTGNHCQSANLCSVSSFDDNSLSLGSEQMSGREANPNS